jgi:hypothetical protein
MEKNPIRPAVYSIHAPKYTRKLAEFLEKKFGDLIKLPKTSVANNSSQVANDSTKIKIRRNYKLITFDSKGLYVNLPIQEILTVKPFAKLE